MQKVISLEQQKSILETLFTGEIKDKNELPAHAEHLFLIPKYNLLGTYNEAVIKVLEALKASRSCYDWRNGNWSEKYLKQTDKKAQMMNDLTHYEKDERFQILPAQLGKRWQGKSVKDVRFHFSRNEFGLGVYEVGCILLTHPEILQKYEDLWIDCPGDEYSYNGGGSFSKAPLFSFGGGRLRFGARGVDDANGRFGSSTGFLPL